jgi:hypothetical protein
MAKEDRRRRYHERWVDCAAAEAAYTQLSAQQREFKKLTELGPGLLARIRGRGKGGVTRQTTLMHLDSIEAFATRVGISVTALLANGDGMNPLKAPTASVEHCDRTATFSDFEDTVYSILRVAGLLTERCRRGTQNEPDGLELQAELSRLGVRFYTGASRLNENFPQGSEQCDKVSALYSEVVKLFNQQGPVSAGLVVKELQDLKNILHKM